MEEGQRKVNEGRVTEGWIKGRGRAQEGGEEEGDER